MTHHPGTLATFQSLPSPPRRCSPLVARILRSLQLTSYKLKCDKEPLNSRLGPPDYHPQTLNCPIETLNRDYVQSGYRETVDGLRKLEKFHYHRFRPFQSLS